MSKKCRFCDSILSRTLIDLGMSPLANSYLTRDLLSNEKFYPLHVFVCENCFLVQLEEIQTPVDIFTNYAYFSSYSETWLNHAREYVEMMLLQHKINQKSFVVEIASNDGYLLQYFKEKNIPILGIEPAENIAKKALEKDIPTMNRFFNTELAMDLVSMGKSADLVIANNVLAHVPNLNDFVKALKIILKPDGIITIEFPHLLELIKNNQFDTIYHEHFSYFSLITAQKIFAYHKLVIFDVEQLDTHGGSLRIYVRHLENQKIADNERVNKILIKEKEFGLDKISNYEKFSKNAFRIKQTLIEFLEESKKQSKKVVCYGAPAKGNTLLNYCQITSDLIQYTVDKNPFKQGMYLPGTHIPIMAPKKIEETKPDYVLILPWNLKDEIMQQIDFIRKWGGKFVIPIPKVEIHA